MQTAEFDAYAQNYEEALQAGLRVTGEDKSYFAVQRLNKTKSALDRLVPGWGRNKAIDFGCGTGDTAALLQEKFEFTTLLGLDVSSASLMVARERHEKPGLRFETIDSYTPIADADLVYCNGVFHHIAPSLRSESLCYLHASLKVGGVFVLWENNPFNPGVHYIMRAIPFDREARLLFPRTALDLLRKNGFKILELRFFFVFPRALAAFRGTENSLSRFPFGAQYQVVAAKEGR